MDLKRQREVLEARREQASHAKCPPVNEVSSRDWATEKPDRLSDALDGNLSQLEARQIVHAWVARIEINPHEHAGTMFMLPDTLALLEAESIRRVNFCSAS